MTFAAHAEQVHIEDRRRLPGVGECGQGVGVGRRGGIEIGAEFAVVGRHRVDVASRDVHVVEQRLAGLLLVALVVVAGHVAVIAPEQVDSCPVEVVCAQSGEKSGTGTAAGQDDQCATTFCDRSGDRRCQPVAGGRHQCVGIGIGFDTHSHRQAFPPDGY